MPDLEITCTECGNPFPFTEREQEYYQERNLTHPKCVAQFLAWLCGPSRR